MTNEIKAALARMQAKRTTRPDVWKNANGTFSHNRDSGCEWSDEGACRLDLRFHQEADQCVFTD